MIMELKSVNSPSTRVKYIDMLRIVACLLVVAVHVSANYIEGQAANSFDFFVCAAINFLALCGVPLFVMVSGALLLGSKKEYTLKQTIIKVIKLFALYYFWKLIFQLYGLLAIENVTLEVIKTDVILALVKQRGWYHLWFLPMLAILYMILPIIKKGLHDSKENSLYFVSVFFVVSVFFPTVFNYEFPFKYLFVDFFEYNNFYLFTGYLGYFVLGHFLNCFCGSRNKNNNGNEDSNIIKSKNINIVIYCMGIICPTIIAGYLDMLSTQKKETLDLIMNTPFSIYSMIAAISIFMLLKNVKASDIAIKIAPLTFGIYMIHPFFIDLFKKIGITDLLQVPIVSIPVITIAVATVSGVVVYLVSKIPVIRRLFIF